MMRLRLHLTCFPNHLRHAIQSVNDSILYLLVDIMHPCDLLHTVMLKYCYLFYGVYYLKLLSNLLKVVQSSDLINILNMCGE